MDFVCPPKKKCIPNQPLSLNEWNEGRKGRERRGRGDINNVLFYWNKDFFLSNLGQ